MKCIVIIPARGGSKRIKNKNIKIFHKKPIISQVISKLRKSKLFLNIYVSTDSDKIKKISNKSGAIVPFKRSQLLSNDFSSSRDVVNNMIKFLEKEKIKFDFVCCVYPTSIFITNKLLTKAFELLKRNKSKFIFGAIPFSSPIERSFKLNKKNHVSADMPKKYLRTHTNKLENSYFDAGQFYLGNKSNFLRKVPVFQKGNIALKFNPYSCIDINNLDDWKFAETIFKYKKLS